METLTVMTFLNQSLKILESDSDDDWESCVSSVEEDEYFYDAVSLDDSHNACLITLFPSGH